MSKKAIILSATSDIATAVCKKWSGEGYEIYGTFKNKNDNYRKLTEIGVQLFKCDMAKRSSVKIACRQLLKACGTWDIVLFATGTQAPVGAFPVVDIDRWVESVNVNFVNLMVATQIFLEKRSKSNGMPSMIYFAGGGTNNAVLNYSAYTVSKIALIKMCELLDAEINDVKFTIVGPGWVKTKTHAPTLKVGESMAGKNYFRTLAKLDSDECTPMEKVISSIEWAIHQPKEVVGGRNFSTVFDYFESKELVHLLLKDQDMYKLRRHGNNVLVKG